jgi:hypothetical protein
VRELQKELGRRHSFQIELDLEAAIACNLLRSQIAAHNDSILNTGTGDRKPSS